MHLDMPAAFYVLAVATNIARLATIPGALTDVCSECGEKQTYLYNDEHLVVEVPGGTPDQRRVAVVICCERYWMVDPKLVGIHAPNRQPDTF